MINSNMKRRVSEMIVKKIVIALLVFFVHDLSGQQNSSIEISTSSKRIDSLILSQVKNESPGCLVGIIRNGTFLFIIEG